MLQAKSTSVRDAFDLFDLDNRARRLTTTTHIYYHSKLIPFIGYCERQNAVYMVDLSPRLIRAYLVAEQDRGLADMTVLGTARAIRAFLNFCVREDLITESPMRNVPMPRVAKRIMPALSVDDARRILKACETERNKALVLFLLDTGLRASELIALDGADIDLAAGTVRVRSGKGRKDRTVYLGNRTKKQLMRYFIAQGKPGDADPVWRNERTGRRLGTSGLRQVLINLGRATKIDHLSPHMLRRTFALWSLRSGMSIYHLQRLMGHEDMETLRRYLALTDADIEQAHKDFGAVDNLL